jgi:DnaJ-class molecular chaperone
MLKFYRIARPLQFRGTLRACFSTQVDPYYILGVEPSAPFQEIKMAFYKLANEFHPDKNDSKVNSDFTCSKRNKNSS